MRKATLFFLFTTLCYSGFSNTSLPSPVKCPVPTQREAMLIDLYRKLEPGQLKAENDEKAKKSLQRYNVVVVDYVKEKYDEDLSTYFEMDDATLFLSGFIIAQYELDNSQEVDGSVSGQQIISCVQAAIGIDKGVQSLIKGYQQLFSGSASMSTVFSVVKNMIKRYVGWFMVAYAIYEFGDCMNWW